MNDKHAAPAASDPAMDVYNAAPTTNYERAMAEFEATLTPEERSLGSAIAADFDAKGRNG